LKYKNNNFLDHFLLCVACKSHLISLFSIIKDIVLTMKFIWKLAICVTFSSVAALASAVHINLEEAEPGSAIVNESETSSFYPSYTSGEAKTERLDFEMTSQSFQQVKSHGTEFMNNIDLAAASRMFAIFFFVLGVIGISVFRRKLNSRV